MKLWADVPAEERITEEFLRERAGASDEKWVQRHLQRMRGRGCRVAVPWMNEDKYHLCGIHAADGEEFCWKHGGPKPRRPRCQYRRWFGLFHCPHRVRQMANTYCPDHAYGIDRVTQQRRWLKEREKRAERLRAWRRE